ncbi:hypothetical protein Y032_0011g1260 [Ancylostoma ceylanicum]|uniref:Uncharacterized protein n=1 Tax=Ancylostoma ceylanicum TaxID=53326 RepID=A0A016VD45_9BILA|nr:hypothetical protein Y032_0011g1260 [Ancylostoma ceylanicum]
MFPKKWVVMIISPAKFTEFLRRSSILRCILKRKKCSHQKYHGCPSKRIIRNMMAKYQEHFTTIFVA